MKGLNLYVKIIEIGISCRSDKFFQIVFYRWDLTNLLKIWLKNSLTYFHNIGASFQVIRDVIQTKL